MKTTRVSSEPFIADHISPDSADWSAYAGGEPLSGHWWESFLTGPSANSDRTRAFGAEICRIGAMGSGVYIVSPSAPAPRPLVVKIESLGEHQRLADATRHARRIAEEEGKTVFVWLVSRRRRRCVYSVRLVGKRPSELVTLPLGPFAEA